MARRKTRAEIEAEDAERLARKRLAWEEREALAWLDAHVPDDEALRAYVEASGSALFLQRQIHHWEEEGATRLAAMVAARAALDEAKRTLVAWRALEPPALLSLHRAQHAYRAVQFRLHYGADEPADDDAHVWEYWRCKYAESRSWDRGGSAGA